MTKIKASKITVDITSAKFKANPFGFYAQLREQAPVFSIKLPNKQPAWLITRYEDVLAALKDDRFAKDRRNAMSPEQLKNGPWMPPMFKALERNMLDLDNPDHARLRALVHKAFTPRLIEAMRNQIEQLAHELLERVQRQGSMDLIRDFALPLPLTMIARILGVPSEDSHKFHRWAKIIVSMGSKVNYLTLIPTLMQFMGYLKKLMRERRSRPQDDLITALIEAKEGSDALSEDEILAMIFLLLIAGHETTVNLIASGTLALLEHPEQLNTLRNNANLMGSAIEELLRFTCPVEMATERYARQDLSIAGTTIRRGELVHAVIAAANRDPQVFERPDELDISRQNNRHLAFGHGAHYCLGAPLARLEGQIALHVLLDRLPKLRLGVPAKELRWRSTFLLRGLEALPVSF